MSRFFSSECRTECSDPSGICAASARTAAFAATCLCSSMVERSAPNTALWRELSSGVGAVGSKRRCVVASFGAALAGCIVTPVGPPRRAYVGVGVVAPAPVVVVRGGYFVR